MEGLCGGALWNESFILNADNPYVIPYFILYFIRIV